MDGWLEINFGSWVTAVWAVLAAALAIWLNGRRSAKAENKVEELENYVETRERMDEVARTADADAAREWLSDRAEPKRPVRRNRRSKE